MSLDKNTLMLHFFGSGRSKSLVGSTTKQTHNDQSTGVLVWIIHINLPSVLVFFFLVYHVRISRALLDVCVAVLLLCQRSPLFEPLFFYWQDSNIANKFMYIHGIWYCPTRQTLAHAVASQTCTSKLHILPRTCERFTCGTHDFCVRGGKTMQMSNDCLVGHLAFWGKFTTLKGGCMYGGFTVPLLLDLTDLIGNWEAPTSDDPIITECVFFNCSLSDRRHFVPGRTSPHSPPNPPPPPRILLYIRGPDQKFSRYRRGSIQVSVLFPRGKVKCGGRDRTWSRREWQFLPRNTSATPGRYRWGRRCWSGKYFCQGLTNHDPWTGRPQKCINCISGCTFPLSCYSAI